MGKEVEQEPSLKRERRVFLFLVPYPIHDPMMACVHFSFCGLVFLFTAFKYYPFGWPSIVASLHSELETSCYK